MISSRGVSVYPNRGSGWQECLQTHTRVRTHNVYQIDQAKQLTRVIRHNQDGRVTRWEPPQPVQHLPHAQACRYAGRARLHQAPRTPFRIGHEIAQFPCKPGVQIAQTCFPALCIQAAEQQCCVDWIHNAKDLPDKTRFQLLQHRRRKRR
jgi:hypothetical protein